MEKKINPKQRRKKIEQEIFKCTSLIGWAKCRWSHNIGDLHHMYSLHLFESHKCASVFYFWFFVGEPSTLDECLRSGDGFCEFNTYFTRMCAQHDADSIPLFCSVGFLDLVVPPSSPLPPPPLLLRSLYRMNAIHSSNTTIQASSCSTRRAVRQENN